MRRTLALIFVLMLAALPVAVLQTPTATHAARASYNTTLTGRLVAIPALTARRPHFNFLLQTGNRTVLVVANTQTRFIDRDSTTIRVSDLHNLAEVRVTGDFNGTQLHATQIQDLTLPVQVTVQVTGRLASTPTSSSLLCISDAQFPNIRRALAMVPTLARCGGNLPLYLTNGTKIMDRNGRSISVTTLQVNNTLEITATLSSGRITASQVKDTSLVVPTTTTLTGLLVATPQNLNPTGSNQFLLQVGDRTVVVLESTNTQIVNNDNAAITVADLHNQAQLQVTGTYDGSQLTASRIQDLSLSTPVVTLITGQLVAPLPTAVTSGPLCISNAQFSVAVRSMALTPMVTPCGNTLPVYLTTSTTFVDQSGATITFSALLAGDNLVATATLDTQTGHYIVSKVQDLTPHAVTLQVAGQLTTPLPTSGQTTGPLCVANGVVTGYQQPLVRTQIVTPCGSNLAVYLNNSTVLENNAGTAVSLIALRSGDNVSVTGTLINGQFTASLVQDHSF